MGEQLVKSKRSQVTIFIIVAVVIVAAIILFFLLRGQIDPSGGGGVSVEENPTAFLDSCIKPHVQEAIDLIYEHGGYTVPELAMEFDGTSVAYLCYNQNFYLPCVNQEPVLLGHLKKEIKNYISADVQGCFNQMKSGLEDQGYSVAMQPLTFEVELMPKKIIVDVEVDVDIEKAGNKNSYDGFEIVSSSRFYDIAAVVQEIVSQEARFCNFEQQGFMLFYPEFDIDQFRTGSSDTIYTVKHRTTEEQFRFALRGCVIPPAF